jgi:hypothetical protein
VEWLTVEVCDGATSAAGWANAWQDHLVEAAVTHGAVYWDSLERPWGVVLEFVFATEEDRERFGQLPAVLAALDAVPVPVTGVTVYPHRGGGDGCRQPLRPRPRVVSGAGAVPLPDPAQERVLHCADVAPPGPVALTA